jgi:hypothetical protein
MPQNYVKKQISRQKYRNSAIVCRNIIIAASCKLNTFAPYIL